MRNSYLFQRTPCWAGLLWLWSTSAHAQQQAAAPKQECGPPPASAAPRSPAEEVAALYDRFECHFARQEYVACLPFLERACELTDSPRCLLNLGAVHHALMHCLLARSYYQQYLDRSPYAEEVAEARNALEELNAACPAAAPPAAAAVSEAPMQSVSPISVSPISGARAAPGPSEPAPAGFEPMTPSAVKLGSKHRVEERQQDHLLAWSLLGAGAAGLTATVVAASYGLRAERDFEARDRENGPLGRSNDPELRAIDQRGRNYNQFATAFGILSGVLLGAGATLWLIETSPGSSLEVSVDGTARVRYELSF
jgi:hypothetical protein